MDTTKSHKKFFKKSEQEGKNQGLLAGDDENEKSTAEESGGSNNADGATEAEGAEAEVVIQREEDEVIPSDFDYEVQQLPGNFPSAIAPEWITNTAPLPQIRGCDYRYVRAVGEKDENHHFLLYAGNDNEPRIWNVTTKSLVWKASAQQMTNLILLSNAE